MAAIKHWVFGSADSTDYDILVIVDEMPFNKEACHWDCKKHEDTLSPFYADKPLNVNLATIKDGVISSVFKGTADEVNNSLIDTVDLHQQLWPFTLTRKVPRDINLKALRTARVLLSFFSRTEHRLAVKKALRGDLLTKLETLDSLDFSRITEFESKGHRRDVFKTLAFQIGQTLALFEGEELYSKKSIGDAYPELRPFLSREDDPDLEPLQALKNELLKVIRDQDLAQWQLREPS